MTTVRTHLTAAFACLMITAIVATTLLSFSAAKASRVAFIGDTPRTMTLSIGAH